MEFINENYLLFIAGVTAFLITYASIPSIVKVAHTKALVDEPNGRKLHSNPVPTLGGLAVFAGVTVSSLLFINPVLFPQITYITAAAVVLFFVGIKDDILVIAPLTKLGGQLFAGGILTVFTDLRLTHLHGFFGIGEIPEFLSFGLTLFVIVLIINSINLIDGIDGLASGVGMLVSIFYGLWFFLTEHIGDAVISFSVVGAMLAFWRFNLFSKREKIFMGDTGSLILGLFVAVQTIHFNEYNIYHDFDYAKWGAPAVSVALLIIPLFDTLRVMFIRFFLRLPMFLPDKRHIHHLFLRLGLNSGQTLALILVINLIFAGSLFMWHNMFGLRTWFLILLTAAMVVFYIPVLLIQRRKKKNNDLQKA